jgi:hypothetical protein
MTKADQPALIQVKAAGLGGSLALLWTVTGLKIAATEAHAVH